jgi:hypothetical protein
MAADARLTAAVDRLIALFNRQSLDLPDGLFTRDTQFRLNGVPFENALGRSPEDPLVLMLARGPAGYRFTAKAVQHAVPDARLERGELSESRAGDTRVISGQCWLSGSFRGTRDPANVLIEIALTMHGASVTHADASIDAQSLDRLRQARVHP